MKTKTKDMLLTFFIGFILVFVVALLLTYLAEYLIEGYDTKNLASAVGVGVGYAGGNLIFNYED